MTAVVARRAGGRAKEGPARQGGAALKHGNGSWGLQSSVAAKRATSNRPGVVELVFERWLAEAKPGDRLVYHRGLLAADKLSDPALARLADRLLTLANGEFTVLSSCGHERGMIYGSKDLELLTRRDRGETVYMAVRR